MTAALASYPPGQITRLGQLQLLENVDTRFAYASPAGRKFFLAGPQAPMAGAQSGLIMRDIKGLQAPMTHLVSQGARQDGSTWQDALFENMELDFTLEASGMDALDTQRVVRDWIDAWDPKQLGRFSVFTPTMGEWWCDVRQFKNVPDALADVRTKKQVFTWSAVNNDSFWKSYDSVSSFSAPYDSSSVDFYPADPGSTLGSDWDQHYSRTDSGTCGIAHGAATWYRISGQNNAVDVVNRYVPSKAQSDSVVVTIKLTGPEAFGVYDGGFTDIWVRLSDDCQTGVRLRIYFDHIGLSAFVNGVESQIGWTYIFPPMWNDEFTLVAGTPTNGERTYHVHRNGNMVRQFTEVGQQSVIDADHRGWGFGMHAGQSTVYHQTQYMPSPVRIWRAGDNKQVTRNGFVQLSNRGDQDGWARHLCYGPGTFAFSDGPGNTPTVTFGPLEDGQIVLITTLPRLRSVVDLSPSQLPDSVQKLTQYQKLMKDLISFATNNNVPPLLQQFESVHGIVPPQGNLYSLLDGRFTKPLPPKPEGQAPQTSHIAVSITNGGPSSRIVSAVTPYRKWPM